MVFKSLRCWLRSFGRRCRSNLGSIGSRSGRGGSRCGATAGAGSGSSRAAGGRWGTAGPGSAAATNLAATNLRGTAAASRFSRTTNTQHNRDRRSSRKSKQTIHPDLPQVSRDTKRGGRLSACLPPATALSLVVLREAYKLESWENCSKFPLSQSAEYRRDSACQTTRATFPDIGDQRESADLVNLIV